MPLIQRPSVKRIAMAFAGPAMYVVDDQYALLTAMFVNGCPADSAGLNCATSTRLSSSFAFGMRHCPAIDPSLSPQVPLASCRAAVSAADQSVGVKQPAFFSQTRPVR